MYLQDPVVIVDNILEDIVSTGESKARYILRKTAYKLKTKTIVMLDDDISNIFLKGEYFNRDQLLSLFIPHFHCLTVSVLDPVED